MPQIGVDDLATLRPDLSAEWHPTRNNRMPTDVGRQSHYRAWWSCRPHGHEWQAPVGRRDSGSGCPFCAGQRVLAGFNDLWTVRPDLAAEWHPTKNLSRPDEVGKGSTNPVWWLCTRGHEWRVSPNGRARGRGCPYCSGKRAIQGVNDLATLEPSLASEWHPKKNTKSPSSVLRTSHSKVWWICQQNHEWEARISNRVALGRGCPYCSGNAVLPGFNDLSTLRPNLAEEWHTSLNTEGPSGVMPYSNRSAWWICSAGHEWQAKIYARTEGNGCPRCAQYGFKVGEPASLYLLKNDRLFAHKIGITHVGSTRINQFVRSGWELLCIWDFELGSDAVEVEQETLRWIREDLGLPEALDASLLKSGFSETFSTEISWLRIADHVEDLLRIQQRGSAG